jgi:hypothetical protein
MGACRLGAGLPPVGPARRRRGPGEVQLYTLSGDGGKASFIFVPGPEYVPTKRWSSMGVGRGVVNVGERRASFGSRPVQTVNYR